MTTVLETSIYYLQRFYLSREEKFENYGQSLVPVMVPVTEPGTGSGAEFSYGRVLIETTCCSLLLFRELHI